MEAGVLARGELGPTIETGMDQAIKSRVRLWLQSERAMGLHGVAVRADQIAIEEEIVPAAMPPRTAQAGRYVEAGHGRPVNVSSEPRPVVRAAPAFVAAPKPAPEPVLLAAAEEAPLTGPVLPREEKIRLLADMDEAQVKGCMRCRLCQGRTKTVFGEGDVDASIFFVGEGPGEQEDLSGRPFVGRAGQKLDEMIAAMGLRRDQVYIGNVVKCRPPQNRAPLPDETDACTPYLVRQLEIVRPRMIVTLGLPATRWITRSNLSMGRMRGQWAAWRGIKVMPTYHPSYILRNYTMETRKAVWSDLQKVMAELGLKKN